MLKIVQKQVHLHMSMCLFLCNYLFVWCFRAAYATAPRLRKCIVTNRQLLLSCLICWPIDDVCPSGLLTTEVHEAIHLISDNTIICWWKRSLFTNKLV